MSDVRFPSLGRGCRVDVRSKSQGFSTCVDEPRGLRFPLGSDEGEGAGRSFGRGGGEKSGAGIVRLGFGGAPCSKSSCLLLSLAVCCGLCGGGEKSGAGIIRLGFGGAPCSKSSCLLLSLAVCCGLCGGVYTGGGGGGGRFSLDVLDGVLLKSHSQLLGFSVDKFRGFVAGGLVCPYCCCPGTGSRRILSSGVLTWEAQGFVCGSFSGGLVPDAAICDQYFFLSKNLCLNSLLSAMMPTPGGGLYRGSSIFKDRDDMSESSDWTHLATEPDADGEDGGDGDGGGITFFFFSSFSRV